MDSFWYVVKNQMKLFFFIESYFYSSVWIVNALSIVCSEMLKLSRNNQIIKMLGVLPSNTLPLVIYIGIFCYWVLLHYNMSFKTIADGFNGAFWWYGPLSEDREFLKTNLPILSCGLWWHGRTNHVLSKHCFILVNKLMPNDSGTNQLQLN